MRFTRVILTALAVVVVLFFGALWLIPYLTEAPVDTGRLMAGLQRYAHDHVASGKTLPTETTLSNLVSRGYVRQESVRGFHGQDIRFSVSADAARPGSFSISALTSEGMTVLGSVPDITGPPPTNGIDWHKIKEY